MKWKKPVIVFILFMSMFFSLLQVYGQELEDKAEGMAVAFIIDSSGSMKQNDANVLRLEETKKAIMLLDENDQVSVIEFADQASVVVPLGKVGNDESREDILAKVSKIGAKGGTDIRGGLEKAFLELSSAENGKKKLAILLSDGEPDLPYIQQDLNRRAEYLAEVDRILGDYKFKGWSLHCIALQKEEAGPLLLKIAQVTDGEYFFVKEAVNLTNFFSSILLVQKYSEAEIPKISYKLNNKVYKVGEKLPVISCLIIGEDCLVPGPHLKLEEFNLLIKYPNQEVRTVALRDDGLENSADERANDGMFSAWVNCEEKGEITLGLVVRGTYRDKEINEQVELGVIKIKSDVTFIVQVLTEAQLLLEKNRQLLAIIFIALVSLVLIILMLGVARRRDAAKVKGSLQYWIKGSHEPRNIKVFDISKVGKQEIVISTESEGGVDFTLPTLERHFTFKLKKFLKNNTDVKDIKEFNLVDSDIFYWVICLPGSYLVSGDLPKSRQQIFHGDQFEVGDYVFEFICPEAQMVTKSPKDDTNILNRFLKKS